MQQCLMAICFDANSANELYTTRYAPTYMTHTKPNVIT